MRLGLESPNGDESHCRSEEVSVRLIWESLNRDESHCRSNCCRRRQETGPRSPPVLPSAVSSS